MRIMGCAAVLVFIATFLPVTSQAATGASPQIKIALDASNAPRKIFHAALTIPAKPGTLTLYIPSGFPANSAQRP